MSINIDFPWYKYALITDLAQELRSISPQFGKTALEKMIFLIQEVAGIDVGYEYSLYTYGPFSAEVLDDLDYTEYLGGVNVQYIPSGTGGYKIEPGGKAGDIVQKGSAFIEENKDKIKAILAKFGSKYAKELELITTIIYVNNNVTAEGDQINKKELVDLVSAIKPHFSTEEIDKQIENLKGDRYISVQ